MIPIAINEKAVQNSFYKIQREGIKSLAVSAARRNEGVSAFSYALARRAATAGVHVLLIDFNLGNPMQTDMLALQHKDWSPETELCTGNIQTISNTNLAVLGAPAHIQDRWPFQDKEKVKLMLEKLGTEYDLIIADMPSILDPGIDIQVEIICAAFQASFLMALSGQTVETELNKAKKICDEAGVNIVGAIMNDRHTPTLSEELIRQLGKMPNRFSKITGFLQSRIAQSAFLNQTL